MPRIEVFFLTSLVIFLFGACQPKVIPDSPPLEEIIFAEQPKNIILMIGDGMGLTQVSAAMYAKGNRHVLEHFPVVGFQKTHTKYGRITDSAAASTAIACGVKTYRNAVGVDADTIPHKTILEEAVARELATGMVTTVSITHATPAAFVSHQKYRNLHELIAIDLTNSGIDLFIGGGKKYFDRRYFDERNLIKELNTKGYKVYNYFNHRLSEKIMMTDQKFGFFTADNHPISKMQGRDYLPKAAKLALNFLKKRGDNGFFLMIEGSQIDWAGHGNEVVQLMDELKDFNESIAAALDFALKDKETLLIVTADHETGGLAINPKSKMKRLKLAFTSNDHTGTMVPVFAIGPKAELFSGIYDNTEIYYKMKEALDW